MTLEEKIKNLPLNSGVYIMKDNMGVIIYVGKARVLKNRVSQYFNGSKKAPKVAAMVSKIADFEYIITNSELDALILECNLIKKYMPHYNILLKDGKNYSYIRIDTKQDFPSLEAVRHIKKDKAKYFGPYFNGLTAKEIIKIIYLAFPIRQCTHKFSPQKPLKRACLNYSMGMCCGPCINNVTSVEYHKHISEIIDFLNGKDNVVYDIIKSKMEKSASLENFELALTLRDKLLMLDKLNEKSVNALTSEKDMDIVGHYADQENIVVTLMVIRSGKMLGSSNFLLNIMDKPISDIISSFLISYYTDNPVYPKHILLDTPLDSGVVDYFEIQGSHILVPQRGNKVSLIKQAQYNAEDYFKNNTNKLQKRYQQTMGAIQELQKALNLRNLPMRIECYDISNTSGSNSVASMVVFIGGEKASKHYRKFRIKTVEGPNDYASHREVSMRRLEELKGSDISFSSTPSLIVIDGGKGQVSATRDIIKSYNQDIDVIGLAEREEEVFVEDSLEPIRLSKDSYGLKLLQNIRDEAHRFAITYHRSIRLKKQTESALDKIEGIGKTRKRQLIEKFGSVAKIKKATIYDLMRLPGISETIAQNILNALNNK